MEKIVEYLDTASKRKSRVKEIDSIERETARNVIKDFFKQMRENPWLKVLDENGKEISVDELEKLESKVLGFYKEDEQDN